MPLKHAGGEQRPPKPPAANPLLPPSGLPEEARPPHAGKLPAARAAVRDFLASELDAREIRITKISPEHSGWYAEAEILVPNLQVKMLGLPLTQEVLEMERYSVELEADLSVRSFNMLEEEE